MNGGHCAIRGAIQQAARLLALTCSTVTIAACAPPRVGAAGCLSPPYCVNSAHPSKQPANRGTRARQLLPPHKGTTERAHDKCPSPAAGDAHTRRVCATAGAQTPKRGQIVVCLSLDSGLARRARGAWGGALAALPAERGDLCGGSRKLRATCAARRQGAAAGRLLRGAGCSLVFRSGVQAGCAPVPRPDRPGHGAYDPPRPAQSRARLRCGDAGRACAHGRGSPPACAHLPPVAVHHAARLLRGPIGPLPEHPAVVRLQAAHRPPPPPSRVRACASLCQSAHCKHLSSACLPVCLIVCGRTWAGQCPDRARAWAAGWPDSQSSVGWPPEPAAGHAAAQGAGVQIFEVGASPAWRGPLLPRTSGAALPRSLRAAAQAAGRGAPTG